MRSTLINLSKRVTIPQLSPTHTSARIIKLLQPAATTSSTTTGTENASNYPFVESYDCIMILECSADLVADPADRDYEDQQLHMIIETCEEGFLKLNSGILSMLEAPSEQGDVTAQSKTDWMPIGTEIGVIDDDDEIDGEWTWQAYFHDGSETKY